jgi:hypothetical protein
MDKQSKADCVPNWIRITRRWLLRKQLTYSQIEPDVLHVKYSQQNALRALERNR